MKFYRHVNVFDFISIDPDVCIIYSLDFIHFLFQKLNEQKEKIGICERQM